MLFWYNRVGQTTGRRKQPLEAFKSLEWRRAKRIEVLPNGEINRDAAVINYLAVG